MSGMKTGVRIAMFLALGMMAVVVRAAGQAGSIEFVARATPSGGLEEPVRGFPFYLLSKSFVDIEKEADSSNPKPDMNAFIDKLDSTLSPELKAWMKKNECVTLAGEDFIKKLTPADVLGVPEFRKAYMEQNAGDKSADFPKPKVNPSDQAKNPAKFDKLSAEYVEAVHRYMEQHPASVDAIDLGLSEIDPGPKWNELLGKRRPEIHQRALELAQSKYLVARAQTDLQGQGFLRGVAPGAYWISTLDVAAVVGDVRPRWDVPVTVRPGQTEYVSLSNVNSIQSAHASP
jgi:hypothetical protein